MVSIHFGVGDSKSRRKIQFRRRHRNFVQGLREVGVGGLGETELREASKELERRKWENGVL